MPEERLRRREEMDPAFCWNLRDLYASDEEFEKDFAAARQMAGELRGRKGRIRAGAEELLEVLRARDELSWKLERLLVYADQSYHQDMGNQKYQGYSGRVQALLAEAADAESFVMPELLELPEETLAAYFDACEPLRFYKRWISSRLRLREHILSPELEAVVAKASELGDGPSQIFMAFNNADIDFGTIRDEAGRELALTHGTYMNCMESADRDVRRRAFLQLYGVYGKHRHMLAAAFSANVKQAAFFASVRRYPSALVCSLDAGNIPVSVYDQLLEAVHESLPAMYEYVSVRKKALGVEELHMYDVYVPLAQEEKKQISYGEACEMVKRGLAVLGEDYVNLLEEGFSGGWIDVYENQGKRSGAYSWGAYGTHPYVLLNYTENLDSVFTLAHEMGHALHSFYSDREQEHAYAGYELFVAEVASTCNEALLMHDLLGRAGTDGEKAYLINHFLDKFKGTLFRQAMLAEFEKQAHERMAAEGALTAEGLCEMYRELNRLYFGPDMVSDPEIGLEWARIPHFYTPFYVYQYATGFSAAIAISSRILAGEPGMVEKYKRFLASGGSMDPIDELKLCGVDMTGPEPVREALAVFGKYVQQLKDMQNI